MYKTGLQFFHNIPFKLINFKELLQKFSTYYNFIVLYKYKFYQICDNNNRSTADNYEQIAIEIRP